MGAEGIAGTGSEGVVVAGGFASAASACSSLSTSSCSSAVSCDAKRSSISLVNESHVPVDNIAHQLYGSLDHPHGQD